MTMLRILLISIFFISSASCTSEVTDKEKVQHYIENQDNEIKAFLDTFDSDPIKEATINFQSGNISFFMTYAYPLSIKKVPGLNVPAECIEQNYKILSTSPLDPIEKYTTNDSPYSKSESKIQVVAWTHA